jgi:hypothetical protein
MRKVPRRDAIASFAPRLVHSIVNDSDFRRLKRPQNLSPPRLLHSISNSDLRFLKRQQALSLSLSLSLVLSQEGLGFAALSLSSSRGLGFGAQDRMHFDKGPCMSRDISQRSETLSPLGRLRKGLQLQFLPELYFCCLFTDDMPGAWLLRRME